MELQGRVLDKRYRIERYLAAGGMATVYAGTDLRLEAAVAIKILSDRYAHVAEARARLVQEARLLAKLDHPNICRVLNVIDEGGSIAIVLERIDGVTLEEHAQRRGPLDLPTLWDVMNAVMSAVASAHVGDIVHRDLKPSNVMLKQRGGRLIPVVLDFGIAKHLGPHLRGDIHTHLPIGTPAYMAPEQVDNDRIDWRADIYALGVMMYRLTTGSLPYEGAAGRLDGQGRPQPSPPPPSSIVPSLPPAFDDCVARAMALDRAGRWQSVEELRSRLHEVVRTAHPDLEFDTAPYPKLPRPPARAGSELETGGGWLAAHPPAPPTVEVTRASSAAPRASSTAPSAPARPVGDVVSRRLGAPAPLDSAPPRGRQPRRRGVWPLLAVLALLGGGLVAWQSFAAAGCADDEACPVDAVCDEGQCVERVASAEAFYRGVISAYNARDQGAYLDAWAEQVDCFWKPDRRWTRAEIGAERPVQFAVGGYHIDIERLDGRAMTSGVVRLIERGYHGHVSGKGNPVERELALDRRGGRWALVGEAGVGGACLPR